MQYNVVQLQCSAPLNTHFDTTSNLSASFKSVLLSYSSNILLCKGMASTLPFPMNKNAIIDSGDMEEDLVLEDAGFFGNLASTSYDAQKALNELGLQPSPPKPSRYYNDFEDDIPFDLDQELAAEEQQYAEEVVPGDEELEVLGDEEVEEETLQSNGLLQGPKPTTISPEYKSPPKQVRTTEAVYNVQQASTSRLRAPPPSEQTNDSNIGLNGLPKYIAAGTATATLLDGTQIRFEKKRRMKGWKVSRLQHCHRTSFLSSCLL